MHGPEVDDLQIIQALYILDAGGPEIQPGIYILEIDDLKSYRHQAAHTHTPQISDSEPIWGRMLFQS